MVVANFDAHTELNADQKLLVKQLNLRLPPNLHRASPRRPIVPQYPQCSEDLRGATIDSIQRFARVEKVGLALGYGREAQSYTLRHMDLLP
jgi:hypothetical protein